jgi:osmotically-inducible protein OsmY
MRDDGVDASDINVDTDGVKKVVVLKGSVTTAAQKNRAEQIATREAVGYRVDNQLVVRAR